MPAPGHQYRDNENTTNPFEERTPHINEYTAREIATLQSRLDRQLGPEYISTRPGAGGGKVHYLAAEKVINLANEVFGFNGWSSEIKNVQIDFVDESSSGKVTLGLSVISRVTLRDGAFHEDVGYGHIENCKGKAAAFEKAKKEAATDAMKRALRNFGNVLGNCLYDKDYLARVTKVKIAPSKWDAENLHRHPDFAPIKREPMVGGGGEIGDVGKSGPPARVQSAASAQSNGTEYEDDYGGNLFDDVDLTHPDEVRLDDTPVRPGMNGSGPMANRQAMNRVASMPTMRTPNAPQAPSRPSGPVQAQSSTFIAAQQNQGPARAMLPPNQLPNQAQRGGPQQNGAPSHGARQNTSGPQQNGPRTTNPPSGHENNQSNPSSASSTTNAKSSTSNVKLTPPEETTYIPPQPMETPQNAPVGFVSGKAVTALASGDPSAVTPFDPHLESPSIRRTSGVDQRKSVPVRRSDIGVAPAPEKSQIKPPTNGMAPTAMAGGGRANFVNPGIDPHRRIGAPSPMSNRNAYKPPSVLKRAAPAENRPALSDVSNVQLPTEAGSDTKKQKVDTGDTAGGENNPGVA